MHLDEIRKGVKVEKKKNKLEPRSTPTSRGLGGGKEPTKWDDVGPRRQEKKVNQGGVSICSKLEGKRNLTTKFNKVEVISDLNESSFSGMLGTKPRSE